MHCIPPLSLQNRLLRRLSSEDYGMIAERLDPVPVLHGHSLSKPREAIKFVYFPESGVASVTNEAGHRAIEVGLIGREGLVGIPVVLGADRSPHHVFVQTPGIFMRLPMQDLRDACAHSETLRSLLLLYVQSYLVQTASTATSGARFTTEERLARWILMCHDRSNGDEVEVTHESLARMLGVRRPGVTVATHVLEGHGYIAAKRGRIVVRDVERLRDFANGSYGMAEAEYDCLMPALLPSHHGQRLGPAILSVIK